VILTAHNRTELKEVFQQIGLDEALGAGKSLALKVNLAAPPVPGHSRTDPDLVALLAGYAGHRGVTPTIIECADGYLEDNLRIVGLGQWLDNNELVCIDLDTAAAEPVTVPDGEVHCLPRCLPDFDVRVALPLTSQRPGRLFSNNVKLFVGIAPRRHYQDGSPGVPRPRIHVDPHRSISNLYRAVQSYAPFHFFVNGGPIAMGDSQPHSLGEYLVSDDGLELDRFVLDRLGLPIPEYIERLAAPQ